ncbi:YbjQ family protein [Candidatus Latescibacterota bacterium]
MNKKLNEMIVTSTSSIEGWDIQAYLGTISSHVVAGTNLFSDMFAGISDIFGGRSGAYQKEISSVHNEAIDLLKKKANLLGGNCIVGLHVDHDEISGKNKSMFMVTALGTVVRAEKNHSTHVISSKVKFLDSFELNKSIRIKKIINASDNGDLKLDANEWKFIIENKIHEVSSPILQKLKKIDMINTEPEITQRFVNYFLALPEEKSIDILYNFILREKVFSSLIKHIIEQGKLIDFYSIEKLLDSEDFSIQKFALFLLQFDKNIYTKEDVKQIKTICNKIEKVFKERAKFVDEKALLSSKMKMKWICECGEKNNAQSKYCNKCNKDIYGLSSMDQNPIDIVDSLQMKAQLLQDKLGEE